MEQSVSQGPNVSPGTSKSDPNPKDATQAPEHEQRGFAGVLRNPKYLRLWLGQAISNSGDACTRIALLLLVTEKTHATAPISIVMAMQLIPMLFFGPFIGVLVDRWDRKRVMLAADLWRAVIIAGILFAPNLATIYLLSFLASTVGLFFMPARGTVIAEIVGPADLMSAISLSQMTFQTITIFGPVVGGALVGMLGIWIGFTLDAVSFLISALFTLSVAFPPLPTAGERTSVRAFFRDFSEGLNFTWRNQVLRFLIVGALIFMIGGGVINVLELDYQRNILKISAAQLGTLMMAGAIGSLLATVILGQFATAWPEGRIIFGAVWVIGVASALYYIQPGYYVLFLLMFLLGAGEAGMNIPMATLFVTMVPVTMRGRVGSVVNSLFTVPAVLGMALATPAAAVFGTTGALVLAGFIFALGALIAPFFPAYRLLNDSNPASTAAKEIEAGKTLA